jgi:hypothetical protein
MKATIKAARNWVASAKSTYAFESCFYSSVAKLSMVALETSCSALEKGTKERGSIQWSRSDHHCTHWISLVVFGWQTPELRLQAANRFRLVRPHILVLAIGLCLVFSEVFIPLAILVLACIAVVPYELLIFREHANHVWCGLLRCIEVMRPTTFETEAR